MSSSIDYTKEELEALDCLLDYAAYGMNGLCKEADQWRHENTIKDLKFSIKHGLSLANKLKSFKN